MRGIVLPHIPHKGEVMKQFVNIEEVIASTMLADIVKQKPKTDRVLKSTRIEDTIFEDLREDVPLLDEYEKKGSRTLRNFESLVKDVFQSVYSLSPKYNDEGELSALSREFNKNIVEHLMADDNFKAVKTVCEGKELPAIGATEEFTESILKNLGALMNKAADGKGRVDGIDLMEQDKTELAEQLSELLKQVESVAPGQKEAMQNNAVKTANRIISKDEQIQNFSKIIQGGFKKCSRTFKEVIGDATDKALKRAEGIKNIIAAWGSVPGEMQKNSVNAEILKRTASSSKLRYIAEFLGRYKEMLKSKRLAGYTYGRGEKYDIEYGNNINRVLTSELAYLATPQLVPLFLRKYQNKSLKQYRRREPEFKGKGDVIVCLDESTSTFGENNAYGMAIAMVLYEICRINRTNFALVHFAKKTKVDYFSKDITYSPQTVLDCAETFLSGGTDFEKALNEVFTLYESDKLDRPDIVFITDGECDVSDEFLTKLEKFKNDTGAKLTGILLDLGENLDFSLKKLADEIYRTSELLKDEIVEKVVDRRI